MLRIQSVTKRYGALTALDAVDPTSVTEDKFVKSVDFSLRRYREWLPFLSTVDAAYWNTELQP